MATITPRTPPLLIIGSAFMMVGIIGDSFLHFPDVLVFTLLGAAAICMFLGVRDVRRQKRGEPHVPFDQRHKRFAILLVSLAAGFIGGYFLIRRDHPEFSFALSLTISALGLILATALIAWQIYRPRAPKT